MQFSSKEDIEAPIADVFAAVTDFESFERQALRRGIDVQRKGDVTAPEDGLSWQAKFEMRGKPRDLDLTLATFDPPNALRCDAMSNGLEGQMVIDLMSLSQQRTRLAVVVNFTPKTLPARLLIQSLKLGKAALTRRFKLKVADFAKSVEKRNRKRA